MVNFARVLTPDGPDRDDKPTSSTSARGLIRFGLPSSYGKEARAAFDASVFFKRMIP